MATTTLGAESVRATPEHHQATRRSLLAALGAAGALALASPAIATSMPMSSTKWDRRLANYYRLLETQEVYYRRHMTPANDAHDATTRGTEAHKTSLQRVFQCEGEFDRCVSRTHDALILLLLTPSPSVEQLATKLELSAKEGVQDFFQVQAILTTMAADARRLSKGRI